MADTKHLRLLREGPIVWNAWRDQYFYLNPELRDVDFRQIDVSDLDLSNADLSGANFMGKNLSGKDLTDTNLTGALLNGANLIRTRLVGSNLYLADLIGADLSGADLQAVDFRNANLTEARLIDGYLGGANFTGANLRGASVSGSLLNATVFGDNDLRQVKGLSSVNHNGPSIVGIDTLFRSKGKVPKIFLRGCGVPEEFIRRLPGLIARPLKNYDSCFISYSSDDAVFASKLAASLRKATVRVWFAADDARGGIPTIEQVKLNIENHDRLLLILSDNSLESDWVKTEINHAAYLERRHNLKKLFPIRITDLEPIKQWTCFDSDSGRDLAKEVRKYPIPDFSVWNDPKRFETAFTDLLRDLQKESRTKQQGNRR
jgi:TIR domain-containing protein/pentapeptide repeat protein